MANKRKNTSVHEENVEDENIRVAPTEVPFRRSEKIAKNTAAKDKASKYVLFIF